MSDQSPTPATLKHLPSIYQVDAEQAVDHAGVLVEFLRAYEAGISSIDAAIDDSATYVDPLTAPALSAEPRQLPDVPQATGVATLTTLLIRAKAILAAGGYPADRINELRALVERSQSLLAALAEERAEADELLESSWAKMSDVARYCGPLLATAASLTRRPDMPPQVAVATMKKVLDRAEAIRKSQGAPAEHHTELGALIEEGRSLLGEISRTVEKLNQCWSLVTELRRYIPPADPAVEPEFLIPPPDSAVEPDFLAWLGTWVGVDLAQVEAARTDVSLETRRRQLVKDAAVLWRHRGTPEGLKAILDAFYDVQVDIEEWAWPEGMRIEHSSTIGINTVLVPDADVNRSFVVVWKTPEQFATVLSRSEWRLPLRCRDGNPRRQVRAVMLTEDEASRLGGIDQTVEFSAFQQKLSAAVKRERPAHTSCYLGLAGKDTVALFSFATGMQIGVSSTIGACSPQLKG